MQYNYVCCFRLRLDLIGVICKAAGQLYIAFYRAPTLNVVKVRVGNSVDKSEHVTKNMVNKDIL